MLRIFGGRLYFNLTQVRNMCTLAGLPPAETLRSMGHAEAIQPDDEKLPVIPLRERLSNAPDFIRLLWRHIRVLDIIRKHESRTTAQLKRFTAQDPHGLSDHELWSILNEWTQRGPEYMETVFVLSGVSLHEAPVRKTCAKVGMPFEQLMYPQLAMGERSV